MPYKICNYNTLLFFILISPFLLISCTKDPNQLQFEIGSDLIHVESRISVCDTFSIELSTVKIDSLVTSGLESMLVGRIKDDRLGILNSKCYFRLSTPYTIPISEGDIYDSICLIVKLNGYSYGDTNIVQKWNVSLLAEDMETKDDGYLYNNSSFLPYEETFGETSFKVYPSVKQEVEVPLNPEFGHNLFNLIINNYDEISTSANFHDHIKGMAIEPSGDEMNTLLGINTQDTSVIMRLYAHRNDEEREELETDFRLETGSFPFSQISSDRSNTPLADLNSGQNHLPSELTNNEAFIQGGSGLVTRIDIPYLAKVLEIEHAALLKAELILQPVLGSYQFSQLPSKLIFRKCDRINRIISSYTDLSTGDYVYGSLVVEDPIYNENTYYHIDITQYVKDELSDNYFVPGSSALLLSYNDPIFNSTASSIVFANSAIENQKAKLRLYFIYYE